MTYSASFAIYDAVSALQQPQHLMPQAVNDTIFQPAYIALRDAPHIRDLLLRVLPPAEQAEAQPRSMPRTAPAVFTKSARSTQSVLRRKCSA